MHLLVVFALQLQPLLRPVFALQLRPLLCPAFALQLQPLLRPVFASFPATRTAFSGLTAAARAPPPRDGLCLMTHGHVLVRSPVTLALLPQAMLGQPPAPPLDPGAGPPPRFSVLDEDGEDGAIRTAVTFAARLLRGRSVAVSARHRPTGAAICSTRLPIGAAVGHGRGVPAAQQHTCSGCSTARIVPASQQRVCSSCSTARLFQLLNSALVPAAQQHVCSSCSTAR